MKDIVAIDFACNDPDNGLFARRVFAAECGEAELEPVFCEGFAFTELAGGKLRLHRRIFQTALPSREWFGNWCWNRYFFTRNEAKRLLRTMQANGWRATCAPHHFYRWFNRGDD
jgi:hypothetical protein